MLHRRMSIQIPLFQNSKLLQKVQQHFCDIGLEKAQDSAGRPVKRVRVSGHGMGNLGVEGHSHSLAQIARLLGVDNQPNFEVLSKLIVYVLHSCH